VGAGDFACPEPVEGLEEGLARTYPWIEAQVKAQRAGEKAKR